MLINGYEYTDEEIKKALIKVGYTIEEVQVPFLRISELEAPNYYTDIYATKDNKLLYINQAALKEFQKKIVKPELEKYE